MHENPSYECMRVAREESRAELLEMRRWDVAQRLKSLQLPESGSHDMLSRIAKTVYDPIGGWTREACNYLRDQLVDLIGGERDAQHGCSGGAGGCDCRHESEEVDGQSRTCPESGLDVSESDDGASITSELREYVCIHETMTTVYATMPLQMEDEPTHNGQKLLTIADGIDAHAARLTHDVEMWRDRAEDMRMERDVLKTKLDELDASGATELYRLLKKTIGDAKHIADKLNAHNGMLKESERLRSENAKAAAVAISNACMYLNLLRDAARDYKALQDKLNLVFGMWVSATNGETQ